jgi:hypothetical protein
VKRFSDGSTLDCPISDITLRDITDIRDFKLYDQPNLEQAVGADASVGIGTLNNIVFENLTFNRPDGRFAPSKPFLKAPFNGQVPCANRVRIRPPAA